MAGTIPVRAASTPDRFAECRPGGVGRKRDVDHAIRAAFDTAVRVEGMLKGGYHHHPRIIAEDVLGAVAVVHIEVHDGHPIEPVVLECVRRTDSHVVEEAEAHGSAMLRMMARRPHAAERVGRLAREHQVRAEYGGARRVQSRTI